MNEILATALGAVILVSILFSSLPLVHADYVVDHASFPPDLSGDVNYDGKVDGKDIALVAARFGSSFATGGNWDPRCDVNDDGKIDGKDIALVSSLFGTLYNTAATPVAYSTSFELDVPSDGDNTVWYYILVRVYAQQAATYNFIEDAVNDWVLNVKIDDQLVYGGSTSDPACTCRSVSLGSLSQGYHLLEFNFVEKLNYGGVKFHVATASGTLAWLDRFRVCVPNYSSSMISYTVTTSTYFSGDDFFLGGYASKYIKNVWLDTKLFWPEWMWDTGSVPGGIGAIYGWGDGFMYPLGTPSMQTHTASFTFGNNGNGLLDFHYISRSKEPAKIGQPKFYATATRSGWDPGFTVNSAKIYGGSTWAAQTGISFRNITVLTTTNVSCDCGGGDYFNVLLDISLGNSLATWELYGVQPPDMAIPLNFTMASYTQDFTNLLSSLPVFSYAWVNFNLRDYTIDEYSFDKLQLLGMESNAGQSKGVITADPTTMAANFIGTAIMTASAFMGPYAPIGALVGLGIAGGTAVFDYLKGQEVSRYTQTIKQDNHWQLKANSPLYVEPFAVPPDNSKSDLIFLNTKPLGGYECGLTEVVLNGTLAGSLNIHVANLSGPYNEYYPFTLGNIQITLCIPWFTWSLT